MSKLDGGPKGRGRPNIDHLREMRAAEVSFSRAVKDRLVQGFIPFFAVWAGGRGIGVLPGGVSSQVALPSTHLMDPACREFVEPHEGMGFEGRRVGVVEGRG